MHNESVVTAIVVLMSPQWHWPLSGFVIRLGRDHLNVAQCLKVQ